MAKSLNLEGLIACPAFHQEGLDLLYSTIDLQLKLYFGSLLSLLYVLLCCSRYLCGWFSSTGQRGSKNGCNIPQPYAG